MLQFQVPFQAAFTPYVQLHDHYFTFSPSLNAVIFVLNLVTEVFLHVKQIIYILISQGDLFVL